MIQSKHVSPTFTFEVTAAAVQLRTQDQDAAQTLFKSHCHTPGHQCQCLSVVALHTSDHPTLAEVEEGFGKIFAWNRLHGTCEDNPEEIVLLKRDGWDEAAKEAIRAMVDRHEGKWPAGGLQFVSTEDWQ